MATNFSNIVASGTYSASPGGSPLVVPASAEAIRIYNNGTSSIAVMNGGVEIGAIGVGGISTFFASGQLSLVAPAATACEVLFLSSVNASPLKPIAHHNLNYSIQNSNVTAVTSLTAPLWRTAYWAPQGASEIQLVWAGYILDQGDAGDSASGGGNIVIAAEIEYPAGTFIPITFNGGASTGTLYSGGQDIKSDARSVKIPAGAQFWIRTRCPNVTSGNYLPSNHAVLGGINDPLGNPIAVEGFKNSSSTITDTVTNSTAGTFEPYVVLGKPLGPSALSVIAVGDSIMHGTRDQFVKNSNYNAGTSAIGWINDLCFNKVPIVNVSLSGFHQAVYDVNYLRDSLSKYFDVLIWALGTNDFQNKTLAQMITYSLDTFARAKSKGLTVVADTIKPVNTLNTNYLPLIQGQGGTQAVTAYEAIRVGYNNWLRSGPANLDLLIDSDAFVDPTGSGLWPQCPVLYSGTAATVTISGDGKYATIADTGLSGFATDALANPADGFGSYVLLFTSGTNSGKAAAVFSNTSSSLIINGFNDSYGAFNGTTFPNALCSNASAEPYIIVDVASAEGTHPSCRYHQRLRANAAKALAPILGVTF